MQRGDAADGGGGGRAAVVATVDDDELRMIYFATFYIPRQS